MTKFNFELHAPTHPQRAVVPRWVKVLTALLIASILGAILLMVADVVDPTLITRWL